MIYLAIAMFGLTCGAAGCSSAASADEQTAGRRLGNCSETTCGVPTSSASGEGAMTSEERKRQDILLRARLTPEQYSVTREGGTERAFTGCYWDNHAAGVYRCVCCGAELFSSRTKYDSGSGWPSFWAPLDESHVTSITDRSHGMVRTEIRCAHCGAHLGHVFDDGPRPTGLRFCVNSASLDFKPEPEQE